MGEIFGTVGTIAGLGGIALAVLLFVFRDILRKTTVFSRLTAKQTFQLLLTMVVASTLVTLAGLVTYVVTSQGGTDSSHAASPTELAAATVVTAPTIAGKTGCELSGTVFGTDNKPLAQVAVGFTAQGTWTFLAATLANGTFRTSCELVKDQFPFDLQVTTPTDQCVRSTGRALAGPATYEDLNLRVAVQCPRTIVINPAILNTLSPGARFTTR